MRDAVGRRCGREEGKVANRGEGRGCPSKAERAAGQRSILIFFNSVDLQYGVRAGGVAAFADFYKYRRKRFSLATAPERTPIREPSARDLDLWTLI